ncbi:ABC transporter ATP-binding protein [Alkalihalobacillus oceani]|uniref:ATP-binding cassette domain-containing protein n=1 Tax=Halalkalibacter oceani TaxID=1653776 RepID=UPI00203B8813|nr:ABC transporter ATP-binding protein [Halalkalibacter oceani]MCM3759824.1 ABC transporter ATP-binding protein [Halalkalibacter oceani]
MTNRIQAEHVTLQFGNKTVLDDVSFELEGGKIYGLLGRNGAGKTSLMSLLAAFQKPTSGQMMVDGAETYENAGIMESVVFVREEKREYETDTVAKWLKDVAKLRPLFDQQYAEYLAQRFKLPLTQRVDKLSRGMQAALGITVGLASRCPITIFDEAYLGLDAPSRERFYEEVLRDYMEHPRTIILSTHLISEMDSLFEEVIVLKEGSLLLHEKTDELLEQGATVTGAKENVEAFIAGRNVLKQQSLGGTKSAMIYGKLTAEEREQARLNGLEIGPIALQELFIHLTEGEEE